MKRLVPLMAAVLLLACEGGRAGSPLLPPPPRLVPAGLWVSDAGVLNSQIRLTVEPTTSRWRDNAGCEFGRIDAPLVLDDADRFAANGTVSFDEPGSMAVQVVGTVDGSRMTLEFTYAGGWRRTYRMTLGGTLVATNAYC